MTQIVLAQALSRAEAQARPSLTSRLANWGRRRLDSYRQQRRYQNTVHLLSGLDDRTLRDIGLERSEITSYAARGGEGRHPIDRFMPRYIPPMY